ncbi:spicule matrix protein [Portunus trituberculatus]|uniref:Spicule matrix protein n=1 Tax=Portunus trituberculatus TaxID=210409 RepID=A0A5B7F534_PORTR|nr:spicule matrix protein [Portunus trituberculatus]
MVASFCAEQCSILTTGGKHSDTVKHNVTNRPPDTEDKSKEWPTGHNDTNPHLDVRNDQDTHLTSDKSIIGDNEARETAPVYRAHDEETKLTKKDNKEQITDGVREAESVHHEHSENIKVIEEDNFKDITNDPLETKLEDEITLQKYDVAVMENEAEGKVPLEATRSEITKKETTSREENKLSAIAIGQSGSNNISISNISEHACVESSPSNYITTAVVGEVENSPSWNTKEKNADIARNFLENDKALEESISFVCGSEKRRKQMVKTKIKKRKRSVKLKEIQRLETILRRHDDDEDCLQVVDPSCTLFVSDGQLIVAMQVPTSTPKENGNATEKSVRTERAPQQSIHSPSSSNSVHFHISSPLQLPAVTAVSPKGISSTCEMNEHQTTKSETRDALLDKSNLESKEQVNMKREANEVHTGSGKVTQTSEEHSEETNEDKIEETIDRENELNHISKSLIERLKRYKQNKIYETEGIQNSETEPKDATCFPLICTNKMLAETAEDTEKVNSGMFIRDETLSEANRGCENSTAAKLISDTELNQQLNEAHKENCGAGKATEEKLNIQGMSCNSQSENIRLAALLQETVEIKTIPKSVSQTVEERTNLEKTSEEEKIVAPEIMHGEEKAITPEQGSEVKNEIGTFERVQEENNRNPSEYVSVVEDEFPFGGEKIQGTEKYPVDSVVLSQRKDDDCTREEIRLAVGRNSNSSITSISQLAECFMYLRLKEQLTCQLTQLHTEPTVSASSNINSSVGLGKSQTLCFSPVVPLNSVSLCRRRYMDALKDLVEELRLMGERNNNFKSREGGDSLNILPFDPELFHTDDQKASMKRSEKEETKGLRFIQCVAEIHSCADVESNEDDKQFKLPQLTMESEILRNDSKREEERHHEITAETEAANVVLSSRHGELYAYNTQREARYMNIEIEEALNRSLEDIPVVKIITEAHSGKIPEPMIDGIETGEREISVHLSSNSIKKSCGDLGIEYKGSASSTEVDNSIDLKHYDVPTVMEINEERHFAQGSRECNTAGEEDLAAMPSQGINVKVMKSISVDSVSDPCPSLSVSNFTKKAAMKINQLCAESNNLRFHRDGRRRPGEFNRIFEDFMETVHCKKEVQEKQVGTVLPLGNNIMQSLDSEQHMANGKVEGSYFSSRGNDPLLPMNCTQPLDCGMHSEVCVTRGAKSRAQSLESEKQPAISETQLSANGIQLALCETRSVAYDIQPAVCGTHSPVSGTQPAVYGTQPAVSGTQPAVGRTQPTVYGIQPAVSGTQLAVDGTQPAVGGTQPAVSEAQPEVNRIKPAVGSTQPTVGGTRSATGRVQPAVGGIQPAVDGVQPAVNGIQPGAGGTQSVVCRTQSAVGGTRSAVCGIQSAVGEIQPTVDGTQPTVSATQPAIGEIQSTVGGTQSAVCGTRPAVVRTRPAVDETQQAVCGTQPGIGESQLAVYVTQPAVGGIQPGVGGTQPAFCETQSAVGGIQPAVCGTQPETCDTQIAVCEIQSAVCKTKLVCGTQPWFQGTQSTHLPASMALPAAVNVIRSSVGLDQPPVSEAHPSPKDIQWSSSVDQTATHQTHSSSNWTLQSSEVNPSLASEAQSSDLNYGRDVTRERERRYREESADEEIEVEGSHGRKRRRKARVTTRHHIVEVSLTGESPSPMYSLL